MEQHEWTRSPEGLAIRDLELEIRDFITLPRRQGPLLHDHSRWNTLTSSLDVIGDTELAIEAYLVAEDPGVPGPRYLLIYGILQVMFVQQDAVRHILEAFNLPYTAKSRLSEIRDIRTATAGHPTNTGKKAHFVSRFSMTKHYYKLMTGHDDGKCEFEDVDILPLIATQRSVVLEVLTELIAALQKEDMEHRAKFKDEKLIDFFPKINDYLVSKIAEGCYSESDSARPIAQAAVKTIREHTAQFKAALNKRGAFDHLNHHFEDVEYPLDELDRFLRDGPSDLNSRSGRIFAFFVKHKLQDLKGIAQEIDEEYATGVADSK